MLSVPHNPAFVILNSVQDLITKSLKPQPCHCGRVRRARYGVRECRTAAIYIVDKLMSEIAAASHPFILAMTDGFRNWIPAFARMTKRQASS